MLKNVALVLRRIRSGLFCLYVATTLPMFPTKILSFFYQIAVVTPHDQRPYCGFHPRHQCTAHNVALHSYLCYTGKNLTLSSRSDISDCFQFNFEPHHQCRSILLLLFNVRSTVTDFCPENIVLLFLVHQATSFFVSSETGRFGTFSAAMYTV